MDRLLPLFSNLYRVVKVACGYLCMVGIATHIPKNNLKGWFHSSLAIMHGLKLVSFLKSSHRPFYLAKRLTTVDVS